MQRLVGRLLLGVVVLLAPLLTTSADAGKARGPVFVATEALLRGRLRTGGQPGDLVLQNQSVTAVIRRADGWLVDFWPNRPTVPSAPQLKLLTQIDGLWVMHPVVHDGNAPQNLTAEQVRAAGNAIEATSTLALGSGSVRIVTRYRLDGNAPRLIIESELTHVSGGKITHLDVGDLIKWGNVDYYIDGVGRAPTTFSGRGRWIGRHGAGGDLVLRSASEATMRLDYKSRHHGLIPAINARHARLNLLPGAQVLVSRVLAYEPIPDASPPAPPGSTLVVQVSDERGRPLPAKLSFRGVGLTTDPDFGNDGDENGAGRFAWSGTGRFVRTLPPGRYKVLATSGIERDAKTWSIQLESGKNLYLEGRLPRVIETPGWISGDLHLHQAPSVDADIALSTRIVSVAAEGIEYAVASDHYAVTDFGPTVASLTQSGALARPVLTSVGSEISTVGNRFGHFNLIPMRRGDRVDYQDTTPRKLFAEMRKVSPQGIIQVNHPRWDDIGYFHRYKMDPKSSRIPLALQAEYDPDFDAIEIYNGYDAVSHAKVRMVLFDWIRLLGQGHRYTATGNSDSHKLFFVDPGTPRNLIHYGSAATDEADLSASPAKIIDAIKRGRVLVTSGPVLDVTLDGKGPGETVSGGGKKTLHLRVQAAPWIDVNEVEVLLGPAGNRIRYIAIAPSKQPQRLDAKYDIQVAPNTFVIVTARGKRDLPHVFSPGVRPFAFTNPIWVGP